MHARYAIPAALLIASVTQAQNFSITTPQGQVVNGQLVTYTGGSDAALLSVPLNATRSSGGQANVNMKRYELSAQSGTANYFCWGVCYDAIPAGVLPTWVAGPEAAIPMPLGSMLDNFHAYHVPNGLSGVSTYRYVWYNTANANDSVHVDIRFDVTAVGMDEAALRNARLEAFPSPAIGQDVTIEFALERAAAGAQLVVRDMLGAAVRRQPLAGQQGRLVLPTSEWTPGLYFISIERAGRQLATRRVVVAR